MCHYHGLQEGEPAQDAGIRMLITKTCVLIILVITAYSDYKTKTISVRLIMIGYLLVMGASIIEAIILHKLSVNVMDLFLSLSPGIAFFVVSRLLKGSIGMGDTLMVTLISIFVGYESAILIILISLLLASVFGMWKVIRSRISVKTSIPYIPFLLLGYILTGIIECVGIV